MRREKICILNWGLSFRNILQFMTENKQTQFVWLHFYKILPIEIFQPSYFWSFCLHRGEASEPCGHPNIWRGNAAKSYFHSRRQIQRHRHERLVAFILFWESPREDHTMFTFRLIFLWYCKQNFKACCYSFKVWIGNRYNDKLASGDAQIKI